MGSRAHSQAPLLPPLRAQMHLLESLVPVLDCSALPRPATGLSHTQHTACLHTLPQVRAAPAPGFSWETLRAESPPASGRKQAAIPVQTAAQGQGRPECLYPSASQNSEGTVVQEQGGSMTKLPGGSSPHPTHCQPQWNWRSGSREHCPAAILGQQDSRLPRPAL